MVGGRKIFESKTLKRQPQPKEPKSQQQLMSPFQVLCSILLLPHLLKPTNSLPFNKTLPPNITTPFPLKFNCTKHLMPTFNKLLSKINVFKDPSINKYRPTRPIDPFCVNSQSFNYTFLPFFYCPTMETYLHCNKTEELQYLHKFYHSLGGDKWKNKTHWLDPNVDYCQWYGIYCCNTSYPLYQTCINIISLDDNNLIGTLPSPWINSTVLSLFYVSHNYINGTIPDYHERLPNLAVFNVNPKRSPGHIWYKYTMSGSLPPWPSAGCIAEFDVHNNIQLRYAFPNNIPISVQ